MGLWQYPPMIIRIIILDQFLIDHIQAKDLEAEHLGSYRLYLFLVKRTGLYRSKIW